MSGVLEKVKSRLRGKVMKSPSSVRFELDRVLQEVSPVLFDKVLEIYKRAAPISAKRYISRKANSYSDIFVNKITRPIGAAEELVWGAVVTGKDFKLINTFLDSRREVEQVAIRGEYQEALLKLDEIESEVGFSIWGLELRFSLVQQVLGLKGNKELAAKFSEKDQQPLLAVIAAYVSERNEDRTTVSGMIRSFGKMLHGTDFPEYLADYLRWRIIKDDPKQDADVASILSVEKYAPLIDYYESVVASLTAIVLAPEAFPGAFKYVRLALSHLSRINDPRLLAVTILMNGGSLDSQQFPKTGGIGVCAICQAVGDAVVKENGSQEELPDSFMGSFINQFKILSGREGNRDPVWGALFKRLMNYWSLSISPPLKSLLLRRSVRHDSFYFYPKDIAFAALVDVISGNDTGIGSRNLERVDMKSLAVLVATVINSENPSRLTSSIRLIEGYEHLRSACPETALGIAKEQMTSLDAEIHWDARRLYVDASYLAGHKEDALKVAGELYAENEEFATELPMSEMLKGKRWRTLKSNEPKTLSLCLHAYCQQDQDDEADFNLRQCVTEMYIKGVRDDMFDRAERGEHLNLVEIEVVRKIFVEENIATVPSFESSEQVSTERLALCQILLKVDGKRASEYEEEIKQISYRVALSEGMQKIDQSRVYVDFQGIRRWAEKNLKEVFSRWVELENIDAIPTPDVRRIISKIYENGKGLPPELFMVPSSQADQVLWKILDDLLDRFLTDPRDGLNSYLSLRVRHGSLDGYLRAPLREEGLLSDVGLNGAFVLSERLVASIPYQYRYLKDDIASNFEIFTKQVNHLLDAFVKSRLIIKTETSPEGLIDLRLNYAIFNLVKLSLVQQKSFDKLLEVAFTQFSVWLEFSLGNIRQSLVSDLQDAVEKAVAKLRAALYEIAERDPLTLISDRINRGYLGFQGSITRVVEWFRFAEREEFSRQFALREVVEIAIHMTRNVCPGFANEINIEIDGEADLPPVDTSSLNVVSDALLIMLGNVYKHGGNDGDVPIEIKIGLLEETSLSIVVKNKVSALTDRRAVEEKLKRISRMIENGEYVNILPTEGGSGLVKLTRLASADQMDPSKVSFGFNSDGEFEAGIAMPFHTISIEREMENAGSLGRG